MRAIFAVTTLGLLISGTAGALACDFQRTAGTEAPMTPIETAQTTRSDLPSLPATAAPAKAETVVKQDKG
ncbi:hypothetical protein [Jiella sp. M17.18]|uniref:hypothetical protein n=1 Tax=Jiella sp. M17.18 TaxID=3234247 RepID=UPI0034E01B89